MKTIYFTFPGGLFKALTLSYDDGNTADRRLVSILDKHALKCSFHLNGGLFGRDGRIGAGEVAGLYSRHEVSCHSLTHPSLARCPREQIVRQILDDRKALEDLVGYPVRGMSFPNGSYNSEILGMLPSIGIEYARVVPTTGTFYMPDNFLEWRGSCHHNDQLMSKAREFLDLKNSQHLFLMYVWGHSYEFDRDGNWSLIEDFAETISGRSDIWYATNIEIVDYMNRCKGLRFSSDVSMVYNPAAGAVWLSVGGTVVEVPGGRTIGLPVE
jgi:hypothetical protein